MSPIFEKIGARLAAFLSKPLSGYEQFSLLSKQQLQAVLQPGDLLLVEGNSRISSAIKYLTQSTWSHVSLCIDNESLLEADLERGVIRVPLDKYEQFNVRICRPVNVSALDREAIVQYAVERLGYQYDLKNIFDLLRFLVPTPPVPAQFRRRLIAFGSGDPTKAICSTLIAQAFQSVKYPILPRQVNDEAQESDDQLLQQRHYSHFTPRDFDLSPYFKIVKPTIESEFDYKGLVWLEPKLELEGENEHRL